MQIPVLLLFADNLQGVALEQPKPTKMRLVGYRPPTPTPEPEPELPEDARIVEVPDLEEPKDEPEPRKTRNVADRRVRVKKQKRARVSAPADRSRHPGKVKVEKKSAVQSKDSVDPDPTTSDVEQKQLAMAGPREDRPETERGEQKPKSVMEGGETAEIILPATTENGRIAKLQGMSGDFTSDDHVPEIKERSRHTLLDADKYKFSDFFYRVKEAVRRHWHPDRMYRMRDPTGRIFGVKDRYTVLKVTLDDSGRLKRAVTTRRSGLDFMDAEAHAAFTRAKQFPNPPRGLVDRSGEINFQFGFYFEIASGRWRLRGKRL